MLKIALSGIVFGAITLSFAKPTVIVFQQDAEAVDGIEINIPTSNALVQMLSDEGRVTAVNWASSDPILREWVEKKKISFSNKPTTDALLNAARSAKAEYVVVLSAVVSDGKTVGALMLYKPGSSKPVWRDTKLMDIKISGKIDRVSAGLTLANTWVSALGSGPFKGYKAERDLPVQPLPKRDPLAVETVKPKENTPVEQILAKSEQLQQRGLRQEAVIYLRDSIDENPTSPELRRALLNLLILLNETELAQLEASRASEATVGNKQFYLLEAQMKLDMGDASAAQESLNKFLSREGASHETQVIQGRILLKLQQPEKAMAAFTDAIRTKPEINCQLGIALCQAIQGQIEPLKKTIAELPEQKPEEIQANYRWAMQCIDDQYSALAESFREALRSATASPKSGEAIARCAKNEIIAQSLATLVDALKIPKIHNRSQERRSLAHKLLVQAAGESLDFAKNGGEEAGSEAAITLGEALKQLNLVHEKFREELVGN